MLQMKMVDKINIDDQSNIQTNRLPMKYYLTDAQRNYICFRTTALLFCSMQSEALKQKP